MTINELIKDIHQNAVEHGFWDGNRCFAETVALCHSELSEALEEDRAGRPLVWKKCTKNGKPCSKCEEFEFPDSCSEDWIDAKPEGVAVEMADCIIRIMDWAGAMGVDLEKIIIDKHEYNKSRERLHGKLY